MISSGTEEPLACPVIGTSYLQAPRRIERYRTGDVAIVGANGTVMDILGREQEFVVLRDGTRLAFSQAIGSTRSAVWEEGVRFRIEQRNPGELELFVEERSPGRRAAVQAEFAEKIAGELGGRLDPKFHFGPVASMRSAFGKHLFFVQHLEPARRTA